MYVDGRVGSGLPVDPSCGERGFLLCYYLDLVRELPEEYREGNLEPPYINVALTRERNGCPVNCVQIPLSYITKPPIKLGRKSEA